ncbi:hypothetical protein DXG03_000156 [Asterophora parasitica]|uniref:RRM domain-containing protein n=1 Tax=Asterophora parasitica TaxID=117018 RepID=A0A9P7GKS7_9AGAR|nr:hypothetical protein DXG03_000156 [Asterophora parasitica]
MSSSSSRSSTPEPPSPVPTRRKRKGVDYQKEVVDSDSDSSDLDNDDDATPDEPVLSHAERRRQKKAEKAKAKEVEKEGSSTKKRKLENGKSVPVPAAKRKNSVWVGNMSFKTTQENLKTFFQECGEVVRIYMPTKPGANSAMTPENRGFAYVDFATPEAKAAAIALSENPLIGRRLLIKDGDDFTGRPAAAGADATTTGAATHSKTAQKILRAQKQPPAPTLFLGNLGFETTEQDIRQLFEAHRPKDKVKKVETEAPSDEEGEKEEKSKVPKDVWLRKIRMGTFEDSGACKGFAFVDFTSIEHATASLINPKNHHLNGRKLVVEYAGAEAVRRGAPKAKWEEGAAPPKRRDGPPQKRFEKSERPERKPRQYWHNDKVDEPVDPAIAAETEAEGTKPRYRGEERGEGRREKGPRSRPKPGAALALAKRESAAIVPSKGNKITF